MSFDLPSSSTPPPSQTHALSSPQATNNSMAAKLPQINFGFEELKDRMARFTVRFDDFIEKGRKRILEERNEFAKSIVEDKDTQRILKKEIEHYRQKEKDVAENVAKEQQEAVEAERAIAEMDRKKQCKLEHKVHLVAQMEATQEAIRKKREIRAEERKALSFQSSRNAPELAFWEDHLGMRIEGAGVTDHLRIVYTHIVDSDWSKEFSFIINMVTRDYEVIQCRPKLDPAPVAKGVDRLNETRDLTSFLKEMRQLFKENASARGE
ncbi:chromosome segregation protein Spc25-domain-containing protein [Tuber brumale]|nr:chromosome segregation protein Spc25-domain-containing protein [Tuber brumale]